MRSRPGRFSCLRLALVGAVAAGYVLAIALASSPQLHDLFHHDAHQREHACLATSLHSSSEPVAVTVVTVQPVTLLSAVAQPHVQNVESFFLRCRLLRHGPPDVLLS